jgi:hypothetical protein
VFRVSHLKEYAIPVLRGKDGSAMVDRSGIREFSKAVLGNSYRLEVGAAIARRKDGVVYARQLASQLGVPDSVVQPILKQFAEVGLLTPLPRIKGHQMREYARSESTFWSMCTSLLREIGVDGEIDAQAANPPED